MTDRVDLWVLTGAGDESLSAAVTQVLTNPEHRSLVAPWNSAVTSSLPPGGVADTDWGLVTTDRVSIRWRREARITAFSLVSLDGAMGIDALRETVHESATSSYLVEKRYGKALGLRRIEETRYLGFDGRSIVRYRLVGEPER